MQLGSWSVYPYGDALEVTPLVTVDVGGKGLYRRTLASGAPGADAQDSEDRKTYIRLETELEKFQGSGIDISETLHLYDIAPDDRIQGPGHCVSFKIMEREKGPRRRTTGGSFTSSISRSWRKRSSGKEGGASESSSALGALSTASSADGYQTIPDSYANAHPANTQEYPGVGPHYPAYYGGEQTAEPRPMTSSHHPLHLQTSFQQPQPLAPYDPNATSSFSQYTGQYCSEYPATQQDSMTGNQYLQAPTTQGEPVSPVSTLNTLGGGSSWVPTPTTPREMPDWTTDTGGYYR